MRYQVSNPTRLWSSGFGRAATRSGQILLVAAVVALLAWLLSRLSIVTVPLVLALIFAAAFEPWMDGRDGAVCPRPSAPRWHSWSCSR